MAHSALIGVALGIAVGVSRPAGVVLAVGVLAVLFVVLERKTWISSDTGLGILAHSSLALGLVALSLAGGRGVNYSAYLFGDILAVSREDLLHIYVFGAVLLAVLLAVLIGILSVVSGLYASLWWDIPSGPSIVLAATGLFALSLLPLPFFPSPD